MQTIKEVSCKTCAYYESKGQHIGLCRLIVPPNYARARDRCERWLEKWKVKE